MEINAFRTIKNNINFFLSKRLKKKTSFLIGAEGNQSHLQDGALFSYSNSFFFFHGKEIPYWADFKNIKLRALFIKKLEKAEVISRGIVVDSDGKIELESCIFQEEYLFKLNSNHWVFFRKLLPFKRIDRAIVLTNYLEKNYFHWVFECLGRLILIEPEELFKIKIVVAADVPSFAIDSLVYLMNIKPENIFFKKRLRIKVSEVLIPSFPQTRNKASGYTDIYNPTVIKKINQISKEKTQLTKKKKNIIIYRKKTNQRKFVNIDLFLQRFSFFKFEAICLEEMKFYDQMMLFRNAALIVSIHGAGLTNIVFSESPLIIEFFPANRLIRDAFCFYQVSKALNFSHHIIEYDPINNEQDLLFENKHLTLLNNIIKSSKYRID